MGRKSPGEIGRVWGPSVPRKAPQTCHKSLYMFIGRIRCLGWSCKYMNFNLYLTKVGLISGGIGSRGPESGWAPGGGAGGKGGKALMVRKLDFFFQVDFLRYVLVQIDLICTCPSHRARKAQRQPRAHRSPRCLGKSEDKHYYDHHYDHGLPAYSHHDKIPPW